VKASIFDPLSPLDPPVRDALREIVERNITKRKRIKDVIRRSAPNFPFYPNNTNIPSWVEWAKNGGGGK